VAAQSVRAESMAGGSRGLLAGRNRKSAAGRAARLTTVGTPRVDSAVARGDEDGRPGGARRCPLGSGLGSRLAVGGDRSPCLDGRSDETGIARVPTGQLTRLRSRPSRYAGCALSEREAPERGADADAPQLLGDASGNADLRLKLAGEIDL